MTTPRIEELVDEFDLLMEGKTVGTLSGDKNSPVFVNNDLELPRIKNWLRKALTTHTDRRVREEREKAYMKGWTDCATGEMTFETQMTTEEAIKLFQQKGYPSLAKALKTLSDQPKDL